MASFSICPDTTDDTHVVFTGPVKPGCSTQDPIVFHLIRSRKTLFRIQFYEHSPKVHGCILESPWSPSFGIFQKQNIHSLFTFFQHTAKTLSAQVRGGSLAQGYFYMLMLRFQHMSRLKKVENLWAILSSFYIIA